MSSYLTSGSAIERMMLCPAAAALPHNHFESIYTRRGSVIHEFLESCASVGRDAALVQIATEEEREMCSEIILDGLEVQLTLAAELAIAYDVETDTARELGRGVGRAYSDVGENEIPCTIDVVGVRDLPNGTRRGLVVDYKAGYQTRRPIDSVVQLDFGALAATRAFDLDVCEVQLIQVYEGFAPHIQRRVIAAWEIDAFASELRERHADWKRLREEWRSGIVPREFNTGPWCEGCGAREYCPAQTSMLRAVLSKDLFDGLMRMEPIPDAALVDAWDQIHAAQSVLSLVKSKVIGIAATRKLYLGKTADGFDRWLGSTITEGNDKLDGEKVFDVVASLPPETWKDPTITGDEVATKATRVTATKKDLDAAIKEAVPRGQKAKTLAKIFEQLKAADGITNKINVGVREYTTKPIHEMRDAIAQLTDLAES
jgi:hypothetical protein